MPYRLIAVLIYLLFFSLPTWADQLIIEPEMGRGPIIKAIESAKQSLDLVMYGFTDESLLHAIVQQKLNGKTVKLIIERHPYKTEEENNKTIEKLNVHHIDWQGSVPPFRLIHQKTLIIDGHQAIVMTFNFTRSTFKNERNFALIVDDSRRVKAMESMFDADWNHKTSINHASDLIYSPDDSRDKLLSLINHAKKSIQIYSQNINDYKIVGALAKAARKGVRVEILTSSNIRDKQANYLARASVVIRQSKRYYIHAKVFIIDQEKAIIGSINLTRPSLDDNRELSVITQDDKIIKQLSATFEKDWSAADSTITNQLSTFLFDKHTLLQAIRAIKRYLHWHGEI